MNYLNYFKSILNKPIANEHIDKPIEAKTEQQKALELQKELDLININYAEPENKIFNKLINKLTEYSYKVIDMRPSKKGIKILVNNNEEVYFIINFKEEMLNLNPKTHFSDYRNGWITEYKSYLSSGSTINLDANFDIYLTLLNNIYDSRINRVKLYYDDATKTMIDYLINDNLNVEHIGKYGDKSVGTYLISYKFENNTYKAKIYFHGYRDYIKCYECHFEWLFNWLDDNNNTINETINIRYHEGGILHEVPKVGDYIISLVKTHPAIIDYFSKDLF